MCDRCGNCCVVTGGAIPLTEADMRRWTNRPDLLNKIEDQMIRLSGPCIFYIIKSASCSIHDIKPDVCRTYDCEGRHF